MSNVISKVILPSIIETGISFGAATFALRYASPLHSTPLKTTIAIQTIVNGALRSIHYYSKKSFLEEAPGYFFQWTTGILLPVIIHEKGHAITATILFSDCKPRLVINPLMGTGNVTFSPKVLSPIGKLLGKKRAIECVYAAGPLFALSFGVACAATGYFTSTKWLIEWGSNIFLSHGQYALSSYFYNRPSDFRAPMQAAVTLLMLGAFLRMLPQKESQLQAFSQHPVLSQGHRQQSDKKFFS